MPSLGSSSAVVPLSREIKRKIQNVEKKIEQTETEIKDLEVAMGQAGFYESANAQQILDLYHDKQQSLQELYEKWEGYHQE